MKNLTKKELLLENSKLKKALRKILKEFEDNIVGIHPRDWTPGKEHDSWTTALKSSYKALGKDKNKAIIKLKRRQYLYYGHSVGSAA